MADTGMRLSRGRGSDGRRRIAVLVASVALHALMLAPLALRLFEADPVSRPPLRDTPIYLELEPRPLLWGEPRRSPAVTPTTLTPRIGPLAKPIVVLPPPEEDQQTDIPTPPTPRVAAGPAPAGTLEPSVDIGAWQVVPGSQGGGVGSSMRLGAGGCRIMDGRLDPTEQRICDEAFNEAARRAGLPGPRTLNPSEARRQGQFALEGAAALAAYEARRAPLRGGVGVSGASPDCPGGNLRGTCAGANLKPHYRHPEEVPFTRPGPLQ